MLVLRLNSSPFLYIPFPLALPSPSLAPPKRNAKRTQRFVPSLPSGLLLEKLIRQILHPDQWGLPYQARLFWDMCVTPHNSSSEELWCHFPQTGWGTLAWVIVLPLFRKGGQVLTLQALSKMWDSCPQVACKWTCNSRLSGIGTLWGPQHRGVISEVKIPRARFYSMMVNCVMSRPGLLLEVTFLSSIFPHNINGWQSKLNAVLPARRLQITLRLWFPVQRTPGLSLSSSGESVEENASVVVKLLIRRPECFGPALRGEGGNGLLAAMQGAIKISENPALDLPSQGYKTEV